jgi:dienelactone hydrolase
MKINLLSVSALAVSLILFSCNDSSKPEEKKADETVSVSQLHESQVNYTADSANMNGYVVYSDSFSGKRPAVLVVHEWWGLNDYAKNRAKQLAEMGYMAMAVDMFGNGQTAANPEEATKLATPFYQNPQLTKTRLDAALAKLKSMEQTDTSKTAAIGYCYGGYVVLNAAKLGADLDGVVSFHGDLSGANPDKNLLKSQILVCHGAADPFVPESMVDKFKKQMDSVGANYSFIAYPDATHAFTNPDATEKGKEFKIPIAYNEAADKKSWEDMKAFLEKIFR